MDDLKALREQLLKMLDGGESHLNFEAVLADFPVERRTHTIVHSAWQLLEHLRIAQWDILEFSRNPKHKSPKWPEDYWPTTDGTEEAWFESVERFKADAVAFADLVRNGDLFKPIEGGTGQNLLREACVLASHNSYHLGQLELLKKSLKNSDGAAG